MAIQTEEWDELVKTIKTFPQAYQDVAAIAFRMGHEEGWWLARTDPESTVSPPGHEAAVNPFHDGTKKVTVEPYEEPVKPCTCGARKTDEACTCPHLQEEPAVRWAVEYHGIYEYPTEAEARRQHNLASWDVPAALVKSTDDGKTWVNVPVG